MKPIKLYTIASILLLGTIFTLNSAESYSYDYWGKIQYGPDPYRVKTILSYKELSPDVMFRDLRGLFVAHDRAWICDTGNQRILEIGLEGPNRWQTISIFSTYFDVDGNEVEFVSPTDLFVDEDENFYICDTDAGKVLKLDRERRFLLSFEKPTDPTFDQNLSYMPMRVVADRKGRAFVLSKNINRGLIKYESDGSFTGFFGASLVTYNWLDLIWKNLSTRRQREQLASFVPTEYNNIAIDKDYFIYATTKTFETWKLMYDMAKPIRRLNALGNDILIKNGAHLPIGDLDWGEAAGVEGPSKFGDITVLDNDMYIALDETRSRLFAWDSQGNLLFVFGGQGNSDGRFRKPVALDHYGKDLLVLDAQNNSLTILTPTEYGSLIYNAIEQYTSGNYQESEALWREVIRQNGNYDLAWIGIGKAYLREENYAKAMKYFELKRSKRYYAKAFALYRKEWVEKNIVLLFAIAFLLLALPPLVGRIRHVIKEVEES